MQFCRGETLNLADGEHEIVGVESDAVFIERLEDGDIKKYTREEAERLITDSQAKGWYEGPWPFTTTTYVHGESWPLNEQFEDMGLSEEDRNKFKHPVQELELELEIHRDGTVYIVKVNGNYLVHPEFASPPSTVKIKSSS